MVVISPASRWAPIQLSGSALVPTSESTASTAAAPLIFNNVTPFTYFMYVDANGVYTAKSKDSSVAYTNATDAGAVLQNIHDNATHPILIFMSPGTYNFLTKLSVTKSNISIMGAGQGVTTLTADSSLTGNFTILDVEGSTTGTERVLTANTNKGDTSLTMTSGDSLSFSGATYALIKSQLVKDSELNTLAGEVQKVSSISGQAVALRDQIADTYKTSDSGRMIQLNMLQGFNLSNMTIKSNAASGNNNQAFVFLRFTQGISINNVEISNCNWGALQLSSCLNANVNGCYMHDINDTTPSAGNTLRYGVVVHAASKNVVVNSCQFTQTRHGVTMGGQTGTNFNGVVRNVTVTNCTSESADTAHYDTHQACEGIVFSSNTAYGGVGASGNTGVYGFQVRSPRTQLIGNTILETKTRGIYIFGQGSNCMVTSNQIDRVIQASGAGGDGIYMDSGIVQVIIANNRMQDLDGHPVTGNAANHNTNIAGNTFINTTVQTLDGAIRLAANDCIVSNNIFISGSNRPLQLQSGCNNWTIINNDFTSMSNSAPAISGTGHIIFNNQGYFGAQSFSGQITLQSASGIGLNFSTFTSGNTGNFVAANSGVFGPVGFFYIQASGGTTYKCPFFNS